MHECWESGKVIITLRRKAHGKESINNKDKIIIIIIITGDVVILMSLKRGNGSPENWNNSLNAHN